MVRLSHIRTTLTKNATVEGQAGLQAGPFGIVQVGRVAPSGITKVPLAGACA
jgi:hypothetical protein